MALFTKFGRGISFIIIAAMLLPLLLSATAPRAEAWIDISWTRQRPVTITAGENGMPEDYQVKILVTYDSDMQSDFDDLRFALADDTLLPYWIENYNVGENATVWVRLPFSLGASADQDIYMYYSNPSTESAENENSVFLLYDDFNGAALDTDKWTLSGSNYSMTGNAINITNRDTNIYSRLNLVDNFMVEARWQVTVGASVTDLSITNDPSTSTTQRASWQSYSSGGDIRVDWDGEGGEDISHDVVSWSTGTWYEVGIGYFDNSFLRFTQDGGSWGYSGSFASSDMEVLWAYQKTTESAYAIDETLDWLRVRTYIEPEPTASVGAEEHYTPPTTPTGLSLTPSPCYITDELTASGSGSTSDYELTYYYAFYNETDSAMRQDWSTDNTYTLSVMLDAHDNIRVFVRAGDGCENSDNLENSLIVADSLPTNPTQILLSPDPIYVGDVLTANASGATDADDDMIFYLYSFYNENESVTRQAYGIIATYTIQQVDAHENIRVFVQTRTIGWGGSAAPYPDNSIIVSNTPPNKPENLLPSVEQTTTTVTLYADVYDNDGDNMNVRFFDNSDDSLIDNVWTTSDSTATVSWTSLTRGNTYTFYVNADDGTENGENSDAQSFTVSANLPKVIVFMESPIATSFATDSVVRVYGSIYSQGDDGTVWVQVMDENGDPVNDATVTLTVWKPDATKYIDGVSMSYVPGSSGIYRHEFTTPSVDDVYLCDVIATFNGQTAYGSGEFQVGDWAVDVGEVVGYLTLTLLDNETNEPIERARVELYRAGTLVESKYTRWDGKAFLDVMTWDIHELRWSKDGYGTETLEIDLTVSSDLTLKMVLAEEKARIPPITWILGGLTIGGVLATSVYYGSKKRAKGAALFVSFIVPVLLVSGLWMVV